MAHVDIGPVVVQPLAAPAVSWMDDAVAEDIIGEKVVAPVARPGLSGPGVGELGAALGVYHSVVTIDEGPAAQMLPQSLTRLPKLFQVPPAPELDHPLTERVVRRSVETAELHRVSDPCEVHPICRPALGGDPAQSVEVGLGGGGRRAERCECVGLLKLGHPEIATSQAVQIQHDQGGIAHVPTAEDPSQDQGVLRGAIRASCNPPDRGKEGPRLAPLALPSHRVAQEVDGRGESGVACEYLGDGPGEALEVTHPVRLMQAALGQGILAMERNLGDGEAEPGVGPVAGPEGDIVELLNGVVEVFAVTGQLAEPDGHKAAAQREDWPAEAGVDGLTERAGLLDGCGLAESLPELLQRASVRDGLRLAGADTEHHQAQKHHRRPWEPWDDPPDAPDLDPDHAPPSKPVFRMRRRSPLRLHIPGAA